MLPYNDYSKQTRPGVDKAFSVLYRTNGQTSDTGLKTGVTNMTRMEIQLTQGFCNQVCPVTEVTAAPFEDAFSRAEAVWSEYWNRSAVALEDEYLEKMWYENTYFLRCLLSGSSRCPGLFGNWMYEDIGTAWHGDYHMNYNTQQIFWGLMSSNRQELHLPYVRLTEELLPLSHAWATDFYGLPRCLLPSFGLSGPHECHALPLTGLGLGNL